MWVSEYPYRSYPGLLFPEKYNENQNYWYRNVKLPTISKCHSIKQGLNINTKSLVFWNVHLVESLSINVLNKKQGGQNSQRGRGGVCHPNLYNLDRISDPKNVISLIDTLFQLRQIKIRKNVNAPIKTFYVFCLSFIKFAKWRSTTEISEQIERNVYIMVDGLFMKTTPFSRLLK